MSVSQVPYPIVAALTGAEQVLGNNGFWLPKNQEQRDFLREFLCQGRGEVDGVKELHASHSLSGQMLSISGTLDLLVKWLSEGYKTKIERDGKEYDGVRLFSGKHGVTFLDPSIHKHPIVRIQTQSGDVIYLTILDEEPKYLELVSNATALLAEVQPFRGYGGYGGVKFPMVDLKHYNDVKWIKGLETTTNGKSPVWMESASQETKLRMNQYGAHVVSSFHGTMVVGCSDFDDPPPDYVIDQPFLMVFARQGLSHPLATLYITEDDWKDPGTLDL